MLSSSTPHDRDAHGDSAAADGPSLPPPAPSEKLAPSAGATGPSRLAAGQTLSGRYVLEQELARGGAGVVWAAHDQTLRRRVAIKALHPHHVADDEAATRFRLEAVSAARINHEHAVRVYDASTDGGITYIVMELVQGIGLSTFEGEQLPPRPVAALGHQAGRALGAAHDARLVHRDVKPGNILIARDGRVKVTDFGIAKALDSDLSLTRDEIALGTARYIAPEQLTGETATARTDVYALGLVLWEACAGRRPYRGDTIHATALARLERQPPSLREVRAGVPESLATVVATAVRRDPADRYADGAELADALADVAGPRPHEHTARLLADRSLPELDNGSPQ